MKRFLLAALLALLLTPVALAQPINPPSCKTNCTFAGINNTSSAGYKQNGLTILNASTTNVFGGPGAGAALSLGATNTGFGYNALNVGGALVGSTYNVAVGYNAGLSFTGHALVAVGAGAGGTVSTGSDNNAFGADAMNNDDGSGFTTGVDNTALGTHTLGHLTTGNFNVAIGSESMVGCGNWVGFPSCLLTGSDNTGVGNYSLQNIQGAAAENTAIGYSSGGLLTTGAENIFVGSYAGLNSVTTGSYNILIGRDVRVPSNTASYQLNIGNLIQGTGMTQGGAGANGEVDIYGKLTATGGVYPTGLAGAALTAVGANEIDLLNTNGGIMAKINTSLSTSAVGTFPIISAGGGSTADIYAGGSGTNLRLGFGGSINLVGTVQANGTAAVSCTAGTVSLTTLVATNGIVTHC